MPREIKLPKLGENLEGGKILEIKIAPGVVVAKGQALLEVEAEKATVEVPAPEAGKVTKVLVNKGDDVRAGQTLCLLDGVDANGAESAAAPPGASSTKPVDKPPTEKPAPAKPAAAEKPAPKPVAAEKPAAPPPAGGKPVPAGPATRLLARELGIDLRLVNGTANGGRITSEDVKAYVRQLAEASAAPAAGGGRAAAPPLPDFSRWGEVEKKPLEQVRRRTAEHLSMAWNLIPHVTQHDQCDLTDLEAFRKQQDGKGPKITVTAFALKACAIALMEMPQFNSSIDMAGGQLIFKRYCNVGVAVDTERGLLVPVIRDVDKKSVFDLAGELTEIAEKSRQKKLTADDMRGGCFTVTNLGGIGGTAFTPIVNYPEVAILGMSRSRLQPVVYNGAVVPRLMLPLSLSYDHRVIDGADGARFTRRICDMLENPLKMLLKA